MPFNDFLSPWQWRGWMYPGGGCMLKVVTSLHNAMALGRCFWRGPSEEDVRSYLDR